MSGRFNSYFLILGMVLLSSCLLFEEEEEIKDVFLDIPAEYSHVISAIRILDTSDIKIVRSESGLKDQLFVRKPKLQDSYYILNRIQREDRIQTIYYRKFEQVLVPDFYQFYNISYQLSPDLTNSSNVGENYDPLNFILSVYLSSTSLFKLHLKDSSIITNHFHTDLGKTSLDSVEYNHLYKFELAYDRYKNDTFKTVYFDMEKGIIRFETFSNQVFHL